MTSSARQATSSGRITGGWVRSADLPSARGLSRGYDRKAVDAFLLQCANGVDWLNGLLIGAENEIDQLIDDDRRHLARVTGRLMPATGSGKRSAPASPKSRPRRRRIRQVGRVASARP